MSSPFIRRRRLAAELRTLREERGVTAEELARMLCKSRMKISKLENAHVRPDLAEIMKILDLFEVTGDRWNSIIAIARDAAERGWWDSVGDGMGPRQRVYADIESGAETIRAYNQYSFSGLLQTTEFTWALIDREKTDGWTLPYVPERTIQARLKRQEVAFRPGGPTFELVLDELVLRRLDLPAHVLAAQLHHVIKIVTEQPRFSIRVLPVDTRIPPGRLPSSKFLIYTFPDPDDPTMVVAETAANDPIYTAPEEVAMFERLYDHLWHASLPTLESLSLLAEHADRFTEQARSAS